METPEGMNRVERASWRFGRRHPGAVNAVVGLMALAGAIASIAAAASRWDTTSAPAALVLAGAAVGAGLTALWWRIYRGGFDASPALSAPFWILPLVAIPVAIGPESLPPWASLLAYGFLAAYALTFLPLLFVANRNGPHTDEQAIRSYNWMHGG